MRLHGADDDGGGTAGTDTASGTDDDDDTDSVDSFVSVKGELLAAAAAPDARLVQQQAAVVDAGEEVNYGPRPPYPSRETVVDRLRHHATETPGRNSRGTRKRQPEKRQLGISRDNVPVPQRT